MAQTAHTPGPWTMGFEGRNINTIYGSDGIGIAVTYLPLNTTSGKIPEIEKNPRWAVDLANARLIVEAPAYDEVAREMAAFHDAGKQVPKRVWQKLYDTIERASQPRATGEA